MNNVILIGRLTKEPETRYTNDSMAICKFTLAVDRPTKGEKQADFIPVVTFGKVAENCEKYLAKGRLVGVQGRIQIGNYTKDNATIYTISVVADRVEFLEWGEKSSTPKQETPTVPDGFEAIADDDIPF